MSNKKPDTYSYKGWIISDSFVKRALASVGYHIVGGLLIYAGLLAVVLVIFIIVWTLGSIF
jgi:hypothetical protein